MRQLQREDTQCFEALAQLGQVDLLDRPRRVGVDIIGHQPIEDDSACCQFGAQRIRTLRRQTLHAGPPGKVGGARAEIAEG